MSKPFLRFEDAGIIIDAREILASKASLSISPDLNFDRRFDGFDPETCGEKVSFQNFKPNSGINGSLNIEFMITPDHFNLEGIDNSISRMFDIAAGMSDKPINSNIVGRYKFDNMYLRSFSFSVQPFSVISASASYDIYGSIERTVSKRISYNKKTFAHALKSFGDLTISGVVSDLEISRLKYEIQVNRARHHSIRRNEHTSINNSASGATPTRMSVDEIICRSQIETNEMVSNLNSFGDMQNNHFIKNDQDSSLAVFINSLEGKKIASFTCSGKIESQSTEISEGSLVKSVINLIEVIR